MPIANKKIFNTGAVKFQKSGCSPRFGAVGGPQVAGRDFCYDGSQALPEPSNIALIQHNLYFRLSHCIPLYIIKKGNI